jgi:mannitol-1-/sugar-/sorbitol-6-/2-deoxyglucose-6-phosphatase
VDPVEAVVFDFDGVILESEPLWRSAFRRVFADRLGLSVSEAELAALTGLRVPQTVSSIVALARDRGSLLPVELDLDMLTAEVIRVAGAELDETAPVIESTVVVIKELRRRGVRLGLASSSHITIIDRALRQLGIADAFVAVASAYDLVDGKPHPRVYQDVARTLGCVPSRCLAVEDSAVGVESALRAGMVVIGLWRWPESPPPIFERCHTTVRDLTLDDVLPLLAEGQVAGPPAAPGPLHG